MAEPVQGEGVILLSASTSGDDGNATIQNGGTRTVSGVPLGNGVIFFSTKFRKCYYKKISLPLACTVKECYVSVPRSARSVRLRWYARYLRTCIGSAF